MGRTATPNAGPAALATRAKLFETAERLFAERGLQDVSVRDISGAAGVNIAALNYHFGSKDDLLFAIFSARAQQLSKERAALLDKALERQPPRRREILEALFAPSVRWLFADDERRTAIQFVLRARSEGTPRMREALQGVGHLRRFAAALIALHPEMTAADVHLRLHFCMGLVHNNRTIELNRLHRLSDGATEGLTADGIIAAMIAFADRGFDAPVTSGESA